jgi:Uma2 family endonuclease
VKEYWLVDPDQKQIEVLVLKGERYKSLGVYGIAQFLESAILKGLKVDVGKAFLKNSSKSY